MEPGRAVGGHDVLGVGGDEAWGTVCGAHWPTNREHTSLHSGWWAGTGAYRGDWGDLYRRSRSGARVFESSGTDGGAVFAGSVCERGRCADVSDRGSG